MNDVYKTNQSGEERPKVIVEKQYVMWPGFVVGVAGIAISVSIYFGYPAIGPKPAPVVLSHYVLQDQWGIMHELDDNLDTCRVHSVAKQTSNNPMFCVEVHGVESSTLIYTKPY